MSTWDPKCGSEIYNPFCFNGTPTDPYSWVYLNSTWVQAAQWTSANASANIGKPVLFNGRAYICTQAVPPESLVSNVWTANESCARVIDSQSTQSYVRVECPITFQGPQPDPQSAACEKTALSGSDSKCVNPCIRLQNGTLSVNKATNQCRVFPTTAGAGQVSGACPTVCPSACVELWEMCPPGSAPLSTLVQTKSPNDILSLAGPLLLGSAGSTGLNNTLWPTNYGSKVSDQDALMGKPYIECYSYNTAFCDLPNAWQKTTAATTASGALGATTIVPGYTSCYAKCPAGTFQDNQNPEQCNFMPLSGNQADFDITDPTVPLQKVFCNPQYFNASYAYTGSPGIQTGCTSLPLPTKQGSTCPQGTSPVINEFFNLEWCMPDCQQGYFFDLTQSTCIATCEGSTPGPATTEPNSTTSYNIFLDYVDYYATTQRCLSDATGAPADCVQDFTPGRCPAPNNAPKESSKEFSSGVPYETYASGAASMHPIKYSSINKDCPAKRARNKEISSQKYSNWQRNFESIKNSQSSHKKLASNDVYGECPTGMAFGDTDCKENSGLCYDVCISGYEPVFFCANGSSDCSPDDRIYACRALCPANSEGLGPWKNVDADPLYTCAYSYPEGTVPADPNLWVPCPDDGRYVSLQQSPTDVSLIQVARKEPLCVRKTYLRQSTCPVGYNPISTSKNTTSCIKACESHEILVTLKSSTGSEVFCQATNADSSRHDIDIIAVSDSQNSKAPFRHRVLQRKSYTRGLGQDPNAGVNSEPEAKSPWYGGLLKFLVFGVLGFIGFMILRMFISRKPKK